MHIGLSLGYGGAGGHAANLGLARRADELGYAVVPGRHGAALEAAVEAYELAGVA